MEANYEQIEQYILGELSSEELKGFENQMNSDPEFKAEVDLYIEMNHSLQKKYENLEKENNLKQTLEKQGEKHFSTTEASELKNSNSNKTMIRIASLAAIFVIGFFLLKPQTDLYSEFAQHQELMIQVKGDNEINLLEAGNLFNNKKYSEAIPLFENYLTENPDDYEIKMALGISLLEEGKTEDAMINFSQVYGQQNVFKNKAAWYMALAYLKSDDLVQADAFLHDIDKDSFYYKKAQKLLKKLR